MKNQRGFTLIELAIVLVIIGIILGAVIKGQDLIQNARAKKVVAKFKEWEIAQWNFYDRKGRFAGDQDANGLIGDGTDENVKSDLIGANFINPPYEGTNNTITVGSYKYHVFFGNDSLKNIMVLCKSDNCSTAFGKDDLVFLDAIDVSLDGVADGTKGNVVCYGKPDSVSGGSSGSWIAKYNSVPSSAYSCNSSSAKALVYYFDSKRE